jgi:hypothetical protein
MLTVNTQFDCRIVWTHEIADRASIIANVLSRDVFDGKQISVKLVFLRRSN